MTRQGLDDLDRAILYALQTDARNIAASDIADEMDVSGNTVRNRIKRLEDQDIIDGYHTDVDYENAGYQLYTLIICTAPIPEREQLARAALDVDGVVRVREVMTGIENVHIAAVGVDGDDLTRIGRELSDLGLEVADEDIIRDEYSEPFHGFEFSEI